MNIGSVLFSIYNLLKLTESLENLLGSQRVIGGSNADIKDFPYQLYLQTNFGACGASIISTKWALTAAHCLKGASVTAVRLRAGSSKRNSGGTVYSASKYVIHPEYFNSAPDYDFALIQISTEFDIGKPGIDVIKLATVEPAGETMTTIAGWGKPTWYSQSGSRVLKSTKLKVRSRERCGLIYGDLFTERMICASAAFTVACNGDSGGALVNSATGEQVGIVSFGIFPICIRGLVDVYSNVPNQIDWIKNITGI